MYILHPRSGLLLLFKSVQNLSHLKDFWKHSFPKKSISCFLVSNAKEKCVLKRRNWGWEECFPIQKVVSSFLLYPQKGTRFHHQDASLSLVKHALSSFLSYSSFFTRLSFFVTRPSFSSFFFSVLRFLRKRNSRAFCWIRRKRLSFFMVKAKILPPLN